MPNCLSADDRFISPGIKIGYTFGKGGGITFGAEVSYIVWEEKFAKAIVLNYDFCTRDTLNLYNKLHIGCQISGVVGAEAGPTIIFRNDEVEYGMTATAFAGIGVPFIYGSYTIASKRKSNIGESGLLIKFPVAVKGHEMSFD